MPAKSKAAAKSPLSVQPLRLALGLLVVVMVATLTGLFAYQAGYLAASRGDSDRAYKEAVMSSRIDNLFRATKQAMIDPGTQAELGLVDDRVLSPALAARVKRTGPAAVFCAAQKPASISIDHLAYGPGNDGAVLAHINFTERTVSAADDKTVRVGYDWNTMQITSITCP